MSWSASPLAWLRGYGGELKGLILKPTDFFRQLPRSGGLSRPLTFAIVTSWLGAIASHLWQLPWQDSMRNWVDELTAHLQDVPAIESLGRQAEWSGVGSLLREWSFSVGWVLLDPIFTTAAVLFSAFWVWLGARIFVAPGVAGAPEEITYESSARIVAYAQGAMIFSLFPGLGGIAASGYKVYLLVIGAREVYRISTGRAIVVGLFPRILAVLAFTGSILLVAALFFAAFASLFAAFFQ